MTEHTINGKTVKAVTLGNTALQKASQEDRVTVDVSDVDELEIQSGPTFMNVDLADGSKTVITTRLNDYLKNNGSWEADE